MSRPLSTHVEACVELTGDGATDKATAADFFEKVDDSATITVTGDQYTDQPRAMCANWTEER